MCIRYSILPCVPCVFTCFGGWGFWGALGFKFQGFQVSDNLCKTHRIPPRAFQQWPTAYPSSDGRSPNLGCPNMSHLQRTRIIQIVNLLQPSWHVDTHELPAIFKLFMIIIHDVPKVSLVICSSTFLPNSQVLTLPWIGCRNTAV